MQWIDNILTGLSDMYRTKDIYDIYSYIGIRIIKIEKNNILLKNNESLYYRNYLDEEIVLIRNDLSSGYEKFILAHELGHAVIHTDLLEAAFNKSLVNKSKFEKQANYFALKFLDININCSEFHDLTLKQISSYLEIPYNILKQLYY